MRPLLRPAHALLLACLLGGLQAQPAAAQTTAPAVADIRPGMPAAEALRLLQQRQAGYGKAAQIMWESHSFTSYKSSITLLLQANARRGAASDGVTEETVRVLLSPPPDQRVLLVQRAVTMDRAFNQDSVLAPLRQRHGAEADPVAHAWYFDAQGRPTLAPAGAPKGAACNRPLRGLAWEREFHGLQQWHAQYGHLPKPPAQKPPAIQPACGLVLVALLNGEPTRNLEAVLADHAALAEGARQAAAHQAAQGAARQQRRVDDARQAPAPKF